MARYRGLVHITVGVVAGLVAGLVCAALVRPAAGWLLGWTVGNLAYAAATWLSVWRLDGDQTRAHATSEDIGRPLVDLAVLTATVLSITVIGLVLVRAHGADADIVQVVGGVLAIGSSWLSVHTMFWMRYARRFYVDDAGGIDFHDDPARQEAPRYSDFAYVAFTVAMTFQVSDTDITHNLMRRVVLGQALTSFFFVAVILSVVVNLVGGLAG